MGCCERIMATVDVEAPGTDRLWALLDRFGLDWVHLAVFEIVVLALVARLYDLGGRVAHWDEGRVAYWTIRYIETGDFEYRPIIHGPFYHHVNKHLFELVGATDFSMRLVVAVVGGLFPLVALLFRQRLRDTEVAALALVFAVNPIILYYSRFMRGDPLVAMFMFAAFACFVRALDTHGVRFFHAGVVLTALGFTVKENALLYLVCWVGAGVLVADYRLTDASGSDEARTAIVDAVGRGWALLRRYWGVGLVAAVEFLAVIVYFYAPRSATEPGPGLWDVLSDPSVAPAVFQAATIGAWTDFWGMWVSGSHQEHPYLPFMGDFLATMAYGALALSVLAVVGVLVDRYGERGPTGLVSFCFYWGFFSVLGYPLVTDIKAPWATLNAIVPLAVPAAVGLAVLGRWTVSRYRDGDHLAATVAGYALAALVVLSLATTASAVYLSPQSQENELVQYAQPADDIGPVMDTLAVAADENQGPDVVLYGSYFVDGGSAAVPRKPGCAKWFNALPLPWYFAASDADATCASGEEELGRIVTESQPPVVIVRSSDAAAVQGHMPNYVTRTHRLRAWGTETTFFVHSDYADELPPPEDE
jgi:uncharacterized protein (TIGR03663 family)